MVIGKSGVKMETILQLQTYEQIYNLRYKWGKIRKVQEPLGFRQWLHSRENYEQYFL